MLFYFDGRPVQLGDEVDFDGEPGIVVEIIETTDQQQDTGMDSQTVGFKTDRLGEVYQSPSDRGWDGIVLINRSDE